MIGLSRKSDYALVALARLAQPTVGPDAPVSARRIAQEHGLPAPLLMNLLKQLHRAGVVDSTRGAHGGYYLARAPQDISVADIVAALEGPVQIAMCCGEDELDDGACLACRLEARCPITSRIRQLNGHINDLLCQVSLRDLMTPDAPADHAVALTVRT